MDFSSAREAKAEILSTVLAGPNPDDMPLAFATALDGDPRRGLDVERRLRDFDPRALIAVGIGRPADERRNGASVMLLCQSRQAYESPVADEAVRVARGEARKVYIGPVRRQNHAPAAGVAARTPLRIGASIGHLRVTAGTLGCFIDRGPAGGICVLSNNHVLANGNAANLGDKIVSPGRVDGGRDPGDRCGTLNHFVPIQIDGRTANHVDCAAMSLTRTDFEPDLLVDPVNGRKVGRIVKTPFLDIAPGLDVMKIGRTTGVTHGEIRVVEVDNLQVAMGARGRGRIAVFDGQIMVASRDKRFSKGGDSGSMVMTREGQPVGLLFAGGEKDIGNGFSAPTFLNPIEAVLDALHSTIHVG